MRMEKGRAESVGGPGIQPVYTYALVLLSLAGHPCRKGNAVDTLTVITSAPRRQVSERTQLTGGGGMPSLFSWPEPSRAV